MEEHVSERTIAIGDIHGCDLALSSLLNEIQPRPGDTFIVLGDAVDRGPNSNKVIAGLLALAEEQRVVYVQGDHEELLLTSLDDSAQLPRWLRNGAGATLKSYGWVAGESRRTLNYWIPSDHIAFIRQSVRYHETDDFIFVHAGYVPELPMDRQPDLALKWRISDERSQPHCSGKTLVVGHNAQSSGDILNLGFLVCIDTNCVRGGWLTALDVASGTIWQTNQAGGVRPSSRLNRHPQSRREF